LHPAEYGQRRVRRAIGVVHQIPPASLAHRQRERCDQPPRGEVVIDIGPDAHGDADAIRRRLLRLAVKVEDRAGGAQPRHASPLGPARPVPRRMGDAQQHPRGQFRRATQPCRDRRGADRNQVGGDQRFGQQPRPDAVAQADAAAPPLGEGRGRAARGDPHLDARMAPGEIGEARDQPSDGEARPDADGQDLGAGGRHHLGRQPCQPVEKRGQPGAEGLPGRGRRQAVGVAIEQGDAKPLFQQPDQAADRGGGDIEFGRGGGEGAGARRGLEGADTVQRRQAARFQHQKNLASASGNAVCEVRATGAEGQWRPIECHPSSPLR